MSTTGNDRRRESLATDTATATATAFPAQSGGGAAKSKYSSSASGDRAMTFYHAWEWRELNPGLWRKLEAFALNEAAHERKFSVKRWLENTRWQDRVNAIGEPVRVNNSHCPIWARMLASEHPEVRPFIELRRCDWDRDFPLLVQGGSRCGEVA